MSAQPEVHVKRSAAQRIDANAPAAGMSAPLGATLVRGGVNFSAFSKYATGVELLLFDSKDDSRAARTIGFDPVINRTYHYWHMFVPDIRPGQLYGFRVDGPWDPAGGLRFDRSKVLLDPYGRGVVVPSHYTRDTEHGHDDAATAMKSVVVDPNDYDWEGDKPLGRPSVQTIVYEMHVRGFTQHPSSGVADKLRGTYAGLIEKIPYLQQLGITAVELLPVYQFDAESGPPGRRNYWGYSPVSFFAPHAAFSSRNDPLGPIDEFRDMVKALHRAGIEVILNVVYNHTGEDGAGGPTVCYRGWDNMAYYILENDRAYYSNYTGTGNTLKANHPIVRRLIVDSLHYWVEHMHVDGFRFDLASILSRDENGQPLQNPPILWDIESDPVLAGTKLIAEAWDAAGLYQVGSFVGDRWKEWNGHFRDEVRGFFRADAGTASRLADRMIGSPSIYGHEHREAEQSVNFATCHDGFTLNDLTSYNDKHNEANGEGNSDGADDNRSWNCGLEGPSDEPGVEQLRNRQVKNFLATTLLSVGVPMILMGDEVRRTQGGNNNAYCRDDETSWFDWTLLSKHADVHRFVTLLNMQRRLRNVEYENERATLLDVIRQADLVWHGTKLGQPDWSENSHTLAFSAGVRGGTLMVHVILSAYWEALDFELPATDGNASGWHRWIDTALDAPADIVPVADAALISSATYRAAARSVVVLVAGQHAQNRSATYL